jgi:predicted dithiol-disulfide oxidoreductase (DUF899 family)
MTTHRTGTRKEWLAATARAARGGEGAHAAQRRAGAAAAGAAVGADRQGVPLRDRRGERLAGGPLPGRSQLLVYHFMFGPDYTAGVRPARRSRTGSTVRRPPGEPRRHALAVSRAPLAKLQATSGGWGGVSWASSFGSDFNVDFNVRFTEEQQRAGSRVQLPREARVDVRDSERARRRDRGHDRNRRGHVHARAAGHERVRARGRRRLPRLFRLSRGAGRPLGMYQWLDRAPRGRNETGIWWRRHDEYGRVQAKS